MRKALAEPLTPPTGADLAALLQRASGAVIGGACGDALGVPHELAPAPTGTLNMTGGGLGPYQPAEWSDETQLAVCALEVTAAGGDLSCEFAQDALARRLLSWAKPATAASPGKDTHTFEPASQPGNLSGQSSKPDENPGGRDMGAYTARVLQTALSPESHLAPDGGPSILVAWSAQLAAQRSLREPAGDLLALAPAIALSNLRSPSRCAKTASEIGAMLTAQDSVADGLVFCAEVVRGCVVGEVGPDFSAALSAIPKRRREFWADLVAGAAERNFAPSRDNGTATTAIGAAVSAVTYALQEREYAPSSTWLRGVEAGIRAGGDTDTVAFLVGMFLGAAFGESAVPAKLRARVWGWPGMDAEALADLSHATALAALSGGGIQAAERAIAALEVIKSAPRLEPELSDASSAPPTNDQC